MSFKYLTRRKETVNTFGAFSTWLSFVFFFRLWSFKGIRIWSEDIFILWNSRIHGSWGEPWTFHFVLLVDSVVIFYSDYCSHSNWDMRSVQRKCYICWCTYRYIIKKGRLKTLLLLYFQDVPFLCAVHAFVYVLRK